MGAMDSYGALIVAVQRPDSGPRKPQGFLWAQLLLLLSQMKEARGGFPTSAAD